MTRLGIEPRSPGPIDTLFLNEAEPIVFANGPRDLGSIPRRVIPKTQKMVIDASLLNTQHYKVQIKGKVEQSWEGVAPSRTPWCSSYRKGSLRVTLDYGHQLYLLITICKKKTLANPRYQKYRYKRTMYAIP